MGIESFHIDRAVGEEDRYKEGLNQYLRDKWEKAGEKIKDVEIEKTPADLGVIKIAKEAVSKYLQEYGRQKLYDIPLDHIHVLREGGTHEVNSDVERGAGDVIKGAVVVDRSPSDVDFALTVFHELFQLLCYKAVRVIRETKGPSRVLDTYRSGLSVYDRKNGTPALVDLEEGVVGLMTERFWQDFISKDPRFKDEVEALSQSGREPHFSRTEERKKVQRLIEDLYLVNEGTFKSKKEIEEMLIRAQITGNILSLGKLIEKSFGKGSFRDIENS